MENTQEIKNRQEFEKTCQTFYEYYLVPRYEQEEQNRDDSAIMLKEFLKKEGIAFDDFIRAVLDYQNGWGISFIRSLNDRYVHGYSDSENEDNYMDF